MMASAEEGYEDERFESDVPQNLHCAICLNVLKQPMQCVKNEHSFCRPCILRYLQETQRCPMCIEPLTPQTLRPSRLAADLLSEMKIRCDNEARGCTEFMKLETLEGHVAGRCEFSPVQCSNEGCDMFVNRKDKEGHETNECDFRLARCRVCGENVSYWKRELHCYVTREEIDEMKRDLKETKDEISSVKELVLDMRRELTRGIGEMKDQMKDVMGEMKREVAANKEECHRSKREPESDVHSLGASACFQPSINIRELRMRTSSLIREDILIAGGLYRSTSVEMFRWTTRQWALLSPMTSPRYLSSSFVHEGQMFVCGGGRKSGDTMESLELKKEGEQWKEIQAKLPQETLGHASIVYNEHVYIFGCYSGKAVSNIYKVSLVSPLYSSQLVCNLPEPRCLHGVQRFGNQVTIVGGTTTGVPSGSLDSVLLYDITRNCCRTLAPLPFAVSYMATVALGDNIIIIGGCDKNDNKLNTVVSYNITNEKSKMLPSMKQKRISCAAVITGNVIVVMGGIDEKNYQLNSVESFSFDHYSWEELPPMNEIRYGATAVVKSLS